MKKNLIKLFALLLIIFAAQTTQAQAPVATPQKAITGLLNRIGGNGAADKFEIVIDANLAENGKDVFIIAPGNGKPCIKGNTQLSVATGINWYLNHYAHINLTWNNLTTDLSKVELPVPTQEEKHVCNTTYRYDFNTCTFSYSMAFWTWERWQQEIDWMALHGINAPLNLVGLDVVTRKFLRELGVSENDINAYIAGPGFIAWFAMNNLEGWGGTIESQGTGVFMQGNPDWWYTRQEQLCRDMLQRMRELGMQPVIPGFSGQVPNCIVNYTIDGFNSGDVVNNGTWAGGYTRPDILKPNTTSYQTFAAVYYKHLHEVMGASELYSIDPFHEGSLPSGVSNETCYPNIMVELDNYYNGVSQEDKTKNNVDEQPKWIIQYWQGVPQSGAFSAMSSYGDRFIGLDLFSDAPGKAKWNTDYFKGRPYIFCMLHNFGGRSGLHGRLESTMNDYFRALAKGNNCQGIGATPEGTETNPILYDMLFELPWMDPATRPTADKWLEEYAYSRYGVKNDNALAALQNLKKSVWACPTDQQGTSEAVILARPNWTVGSVSSWSTSAVYWDTQDVLLAADELSSITDLKTEDGIANYNYDFIDVIRQAMVDYAAELLPLINAARNNNTEYTRLYQLYLQLMLDLDEMLSYDENFKLERWTSLARNIANEVDGTTENDRNWLEWNARTQITVWSKGDTDLHDYSNRCWAGLIKDFHYKRWEKFFTTNGGSFDGGWFSGFEYPWTVDFNDTYDLAGDYSKVVIPTDMTATEKAKETFGNYFGRVKGKDKNYIFPMGITRDATKSGVITEVYRGQEVELPLETGKNVTISSVWIDLNNDGAASNNEMLTANGNKVTIPDDAVIGQTKAKVTYSDGTVITFNIALIEDITDARTVTAVAGANGSVAIEGTNELTVTTTEAVKITATANTGYNFNNWTNTAGEVVSNNNPFIYYDKKDATFTANFIQDKWGVVACNGSFSGDIAGYSQFIHNLTIAYRNREPETIFEATTAPTEIFNTIPHIINVPQGASFDVEYNNGGSDGLKYCYFRAFIDLNADGDFDDDGELLKEVGTNGAQNAAVCSNKINVLLPYDMPLGITHMRLRFDGAWDNNSNPSGKGAKDASVRPVYEIIINVTDQSDKAATIKVETNNQEWGTVEVWTDETPDGSTGTEWNVTKGVKFYLRATKASEDAEFLGWYDHYGRLLTMNLEHTMYAREDATYTARFRKFLEIDGWQIEYRTQPGSEIVTNKLANGVKPEAGKKYYIYAPTNYNSVSATRYLYDNNGTLATSVDINGNNFIWTCIVNNDNTYSFLNASGKYFANNGSYHISIGATAAKYYLEDPTTSGCALKNAADYSGGKYMVTKHDGSAFNRNSSKTNGEWCSDYVFVEVTTPDVVIFTNVRQSGNHDLVIPEAVEVLGEDLKIVGFDNNLFNNNKDLWSIELPKSIEFLSNKSLFSHTLTGNGQTQTFDVDIKNNEAWTVTMEVERTGELTGWGSCLIASGNTPAKPDGSNYAEGFQFYLQCTEKGAERDKLIIKTKTQTGDSWFFDNVYQEEKFSVIIEYNGAQQLSVNVLKEDGTNATNHNGKQEPIVFTDCTIQNITQLCTNVQATITAHVEITKAAEANPFSGCSNLDKIAIDGECKAYYVNNDGDLYNASNVLVCSPEGKAKGADRRALAAIIEDMKTLTAQVGTYNPTGKANKFTLQAEDANAIYYLWANSTETSEGNIAHLVDGIKGNDSNFFHTNWHNAATAEGYHYIEVDLGAKNSHSVLQFAYHTRTDCSDDFPDAITVMGSNDKQNYTEIHTENSNLPQAVNKEFKSAVFDCGKAYRYLRFKVTAERTYWHMGEFELYFMTSTADVFSYLESGITNEQAAAAYDALLDAKFVFENGTTAAEIQTAKAALQNAYNALKELLKAALPVELTLDENNPKLYKIVIKRADDGSKVLRYDNNDGMVAVGNYADNKTWQAWYFMGGTEGVTIHPFNANGKVLSADNTSNASAKVWAANKGEKAFYEWKFVSRTDDYYNIQVHDGSNYFSNNGGIDQKMGFWSGSPESDGGSLFKFVEAEFENDNARYFQLIDLKESNTGYFLGTSIGLYTATEEYQEAKAKATELISAGSTSNSNACYEAYKALYINPQVKYNAPDPAKFYVIKSTATNDYCKGKYVHTNYEAVGAYNHRHLKFANKDEISQFPLAVFQFEATGTQGEYKMKNLHTGLYVKSFGKNAEHMGDSTAAAIVKISGIADGQVTLRIGTNSPMHAQNDNKVIVGWDAAVGNASTWTIDEVSNINDICYNAKISGVEHSTLYLNYPVAIPAGVKAYTANEIVNDKWLNMKEIFGTIPAKTAVVLKGSAGNYTFNIAKETRSNIKCVFEGTTYKQTITKGNGKYYVLANIDTTPDDGIDNKELGFYIADKDKETFINAANKAYLHDSTDGSQVSFFGFRFDGDTTEIEEVTEEKAENKEIYDLAGRRITEITSPGIYIINGKKIFIR